MAKAAESQTKEEVRRSWEVKRHGGCATSGQSDRAQHSKRFGRKRPQACKTLSVRLPVRVLPGKRREWLELAKTGRTLSFRILKIFSGAEDVRTLNVTRDPGRFLNFENVFGRYGTPLRNRLWCDIDDTCDCARATSGTFRFIQS